MNKSSNRQKNSPLGPIPVDWEVVRLGEVVEIYDHKRIPLSEMERNKRKGQYPYCGANGVIDFIDDYIFDGVYVLLAEDGGDYLKFGNSAYIMSGKFWVNNHAHVVKVVESMLNNWFLMYSLNFLNLRPYIVGSTRTKLNQDQMKNIKIPLPPLPEQRRIAEVLLTVDEAIFKVEEEIEYTERLKRGLMQHLLTCGIGHSLFKDSPLGKIPEDWEVVRLGEVGNIITGKTPSTKVKEFWNGEIMFVTPSDFKDRKYIDDTERYITKEGAKKASMIPPQSVLVVCIASVGEVAINLDYCITNQQINAIVPNNKTDAEFLYYSLKYRSWLLKWWAGTTTTPIVKKSLFEKFPIPLPPLPEQKKISEILMAVDRKLDLLRQKKYHLQRLKKGLMNDLLTGRRRLKVEWKNESLF